MTFKIDLKIFLLSLILLLHNTSNIYFLLFAFAIIHELGHLFCGLFLGLKVKNIKIMPIGLSIEFNKYNIAWWKELIICIAGPAINFAMAAIIIIFNNNNYNNIIYSNLIIGIFNLMPIIPLDGGRALKILLKKLYPFDIGYKYIKNISYITMAFLTIILIILIFYTKNILMIITIIYLWIIVISELKKLRTEKVIFDILDLNKSLTKTKHSGKI